MTSQLENVKTIDLEEWLTLATAPAPTKLKQGQTPDMKNCWVDEKPGSVITAPGYIKVGSIPSGNPVAFCLNYFKVSAGTQTFVVSDNATVWTTVDFQNFTSIITGLSSAFQLRGKVIRDKLWFTNGSDAVRTFDGTTVMVLDGSGGTPNVPKGRFIDYHDERVWLYHTTSNRSAVYFSALTDSSGTIIAPDNSAAWPVNNFLQISEGDADFGTGQMIYRGYLFFFKQYTIWRLVGYDEYTYARVKTRASTGTRFNESLQILDSLIHLIGVDGIYVFDGEEAERISDIIDPSTTSQTAFGFNQLQQPNTNAQFWQVIQTVDWNAGTVPTDLAINNSATLIPADDSQADFQAGPTQTNINLTTLPGILQLSNTNAGKSNLNLIAGQPVTATQDAGVQQIGTPNFLTDGDLVNSFGFSCPPNAYGHISIGFINALPITTIVLKGLIPGQSSGFIRFTNLPNPLSVSPSTNVQIVNGGVQFPSNTNPIDYTITFAVQNVAAIQADLISNSGIVMTEMQVFATAYNTTGKFTSKTLDLGLTPVSLGTFSVQVTLNGETATYFTQSSVDGSAWGAEVTVLNGAAITSTPRRYLRWGVNLASDGLASPQIDAAYLPAVYLSAIHNTGGSIFSWGPFESDRSSLGQTINYYYRTATTSGGIAAATWNLIVPGGVLSTPIAQQYIQFKIEISGGDASHLPIVTSVTINWVTGTVTQPQTLQNVASTYWHNRYWLSAAGPGATANNSIIIRGKKTFGSPWMLKDWNILSFTRFQDSLYGGSSLDGSIFRLDTGYSKNGAAMDSYFHTGDFVFGGFTANLVELLVEAQRLGSWNLNIGVSVDGGKTFVDVPMDLSISTYDTNYIKRFNLSYTTTRFRLRFRTNGADTPFQVHRCAAFYRLDVERGSIRGDYIT